MIDEPSTLPAPEGPAPPMLSFEEWKAQGDPQLDPLATKAVMRRRYDAYCAGYRQLHGIADPAPGDEAAVISREDWDHLWVQMCGRAKRSPEIPQVIHYSTPSNSHNWIAHYIGLNREPAGWFRAHHTHTAEGREYDEEMVAGAEQPAGDGWSPVYHPVNSVDAAVTLFNEVHELAVSFMGAANESSEAKISATLAAEMLAEILKRSAGTLKNIQVPSEFKSSTPEHMEWIATNLDILAANIEVLDGEHIGGAVGRGIAQSLRGRSIILREVAKLRRIRKG